MSKREKPLPTPAGGPFSKKKRFGEEAQAQEPLLADALAAAAAQGSLEDFMKSHIPDNEHARNLTMMMLGMSGMSGMMPDAGFPSGPGAPEAAGQQVEEDMEKPAAQRSEEVPEEVMKAVQSGNIQELMALLEQEHRRRKGEAAPSGEAPAPAGEEVHPEGQEFPRLSEVEKDTLSELARIASENRLDVDWLVLRALKVYIDEYRKTGKL